MNNKQVSLDLGVDEQLKHIAAKQSFFAASADKVDNLRDNFDGRKIIWWAIFATYSTSIALCLFFYKTIHNTINDWQVLKPSI